MTPDVSIIIVSYNTRVLTLECLHSIFQETSRHSAEVIVVDNASSDGSAEAIASEFPNVKLVTSAKNLGFAAGNNVGLKIARGRYLLLLNPDTLVIEGAVDTMVNFLDMNLDVGCAGCQVLEDETTIQRTCFRFPSPLNVFFDVSRLSKVFHTSRIFGRSWMGDWDRRTQRDVDVVSGMFLMIRTEVFDRIGLMDEAYFVYGEETDWCFQMQKAGIRRVFTPTAKIIHRDGGGKSTKLASRRMYVQLHKSLLIFHEKNYGRVSSASVRLMIGLAMIARWMRFGIESLLTSNERAAAKAGQSLAAIRFHFLGQEPAF